jgi:hypothetical protein
MVTLFFLIDAVKVFFLIVWDKKTIPFDNKISEKKKENMLHQN